VAFCRTCGKPLCNQCTRDVRGVIYCEACLAARMEGAPAPGTAPGYTPVPPSPPPPTGYQQFMDQGLGIKVPPGPTSGPNPAVAGILAGFFPFGVGAVYTGQYAKGLAHLLILFGLIWGQTTTESDGVHIALGLAMGFFYIYQIIDAVRSAKALQTGQPAPDPFGLAHTFSTGDKVDTSRIPTGAVVLIGLGFLFMLETMGFHFFNLGHLWPLILIGIGVWLFAVRWGYVGGGKVYDCERCRARGIMGPAVLITLGTLFLLEQVDVLSFHKTWPLLLVVIGLVKVVQSNASTEGHVYTQLPPSGMPGPSGQVQPPVSEVKNG